MARLRRHDPDTPRIPRKDRRGMNPVLAGAIVLVLVAVGVYFGFAKELPFTHGFRVNAVFENSNQIKVDSPVRIAGVDVGRVTRIERYQDTDATLVTFELDDAALPLHKDATAKIRPRIFLEGNFFVDLEPGTPTAPTLGDGDTIPITQTAAPVQLGDVLTSLQQDTRRSLQQVLRDYGDALTSEPTAEDDAQADPSVQGETAAQALNDSLDHAGPALRDVSIVNEALLGVRADDLSATIAGLATIAGALGRDERRLQDLITSFDRTMAIFADESANLQATVRELRPTLETTSDTLAGLNEAFPPTRAFAREILPGVRETPETIEAAFPWIRQTRALLRPDELQGVVRELSPAVRDLAASAGATNALLPEAELVAKCVTRVLLPTGDIVIEDGPLTTGKENYKEFWYAMVGLAGEGQNFDGNGMYVRFSPGAGPQTVSTGKATRSGEALFGRSNEAPIGTRPAYPGRRPPYRPDVPCHTQRIPDLNGARTGPPDGSRPQQQTTIGNPRELVQTAPGGPVQAALASLATDLTGLADQATARGASGSGGGAAARARGRERSGGRDGGRASTRAAGRPPP
ncbi:MAG: MCE family protein, partial [Solirubrobacteraceae bacterium]|nr:MCE family protein [Solirubrobacteraceae bacterium]